MHEGITLIPKSYLEPSGHLSWPTGRPGPTNSISGHGWTRVVTNPAPAAGANWTITVPAKVHWRVISLRTALVTSAAAANRVAQLVVDDGPTNTNTMFSMVPSVVQTATQTTIYNWAGGLAPRNLVLAGSSIQQFSELPIGLEVMAGWRIRVSTTAIDATDAWSAQVMLVEEWIEE